MEKRDYGLAEVWREVLQVLNGPGLLLVSVDETGKPNVMTIGWATLGIVWGRPILTVFVRPSRFTYGLVDATGDFTVNVPPPEMAETVQYCGTVSGREHDKFAERGLTPAPSRHVRSPIIEECLLHYECRVVHKNDVEPRTLNPDILTHAYPQGDFHRVFYGEVLAVYGIPDWQARLGGVRL
jgi:flavin reductase (DIM6/NTAB) family NADH-FMN oxidoreductase RutF